MVSEQEVVIQILRMIEIADKLFKAELAEQKYQILYLMVEVNGKIAASGGMLELRYGILFDLLSKDYKAMHKDKHTKLFKS